MSPSIEGMRVFNYKSQAWFWPIGDDEEIQFGVKDLLIDRWIYKIEIRWCSHNGIIEPHVHSTLADWINAIQLRGIANKLVVL